MSQARNKNKVVQKPRAASNYSRDKRRSKNSVESKDLSALGGGVMRNPSSSNNSDSDYDDNIQAKGQENLFPNNGTAKKEDKPGSKRPSIQFKEQMFMTEQDLDDLDLNNKKIVPVHFGSDSQIQKNKSHRMTNKVRTTKYTILTWAPFSLLFQFKRAANLYFLFISILTLQSFSSKSPASMIGTFSFVLFLTMLKEGFENYLRYKADKEANSRTCMRYSYTEKAFEECKWKDIKVGDMLKIEKEGKFPVDMLLIKTPNKDGLVFVDTSNLDGETNLKDKM